MTLIVQEPPGLALRQVERPRGVSFYVLSTRFDPVCCSESCWSTAWHHHSSRPLWGLPYFSWRLLDSCCSPSGGSVPFVKSVVAGGDMAAARFQVIRWPPWACWRRTSRIQTW